MKFLNNKGISLVEAMIGVGIASAAGVAYLTHVQNTAKHESRTKIRSAVSLLEAQAQDYLKSRDICNKNVGLAFNNVPIIGSEVSGDKNYSALKNNGYKDASGASVDKDIFRVGDTYEGDRIYVSGVNYKIVDVKDIKQVGSPWNKTGKVRISVDMQTCRNNGAVVRKKEVKFGTKVGAIYQTACPEEMRQTTSKVFEKLIAFKADSSGLFTESDVKEQVVNPITGKMEWKVTGKKKNLTCADSQDALVEASKEYTDLKNCVTEVKMAMMMGRVGEFEPCGISLQAGPEQSRKITNNQTIPLPGRFIPNSLQADVIGGGGGGGGGYTDCHGINNYHGGGGEAGQLLTQVLPATGGSCIVKIGAGGDGGADKQVGKNGFPTTIVCGGFSATAIGGAGGPTCVGKSNCGTNGKDVYDLTGKLLTKGGAGRCRSHDYRDGGSYAREGSGGGGGADRSRQNGHVGGSGVVYVKWKEYVITDKSGTLNLLDMTIDDLYSLGASTASVGGN